MLSVVGLWLNRVHGRSLAQSGSCSGSCSGWIEAVVWYDLGRGRVGFMFGFRPWSGRIYALVG